MMSRKIKAFTLLWLITVSAIIPYTSSGQGYAGPDKNMMKDSSVVIGGSGCSNCCIKWTPTTGLSNPNILNPVASPAQTTTYTIKVVGPDFSFSDVDQMTVTVVDGLSDITATPKQCCWKKGDAISLDQFTITTNPPGLASSLTISPTTVPTNVFTQGVGTLPVTISGKGTNNTTKSTTVNITVVDEDAQTQVQVGLGQFDPAEILKVVDECINKVRGPCNPTGGLTANVSFSKGKLCCPKSGCVKEMYAYNGTYNYDKGVSCDQPFYGVPYIASLNLRISASFGLAISLGNVKTTCDGVDVCYGATFTGSIGGGVSGTILGGSILDASLQLVASVTADPLEYCIPSGKTKAGIGTDNGNICFKADLVGSVTTLSFFTEQVSVNVISQRCLY